ncbi:MAG: MamK family actin-like protein [Planctomycetota bacterium]
MSDKDHGVLYIGMDLGTSRTSISASNGVRETVESYVGYPKDVVARKMIGRDVMFGVEALGKRLSLNIFKPLEKGVIKDSDDGATIEENMKAARDLIQHAISLAKPRKDELIYAVIGAPAEASIHNKKAILDAAREVIDSVMLCSEPFSVAYGLDMLDDTLVIDIGAGTVDLCRMHGTMPDADDQITLTTAGDYVDDQLYELLKERCEGADFNLNMVKRFKEKHAFVTTASEPVIATFPVEGKPTQFDVTDEVRTACRKMVPPIVDALGKLISSFDPEFQDRLRSRVLLGGGGSQVRGLDRAIEEVMAERLGGGQVLKVEEPMYAGSNGALKIAHDMPEEYWEKLR